MATRTVTGTLYHHSGDPWSDARIQIQLLRAVITVDGEYPVHVIRSTTDEVGVYTAVLVAGLSVPYKLTLPDASIYLFYLPLGETDVTIEALIGLPLTEIADSTDLTAHELASDPHPIYMTEAELALAGFLTLTAITEESDTRAGRDIVLQNQLQAEVTGREAADDALLAATATEAEARATADGGLQAQIAGLLARITALEDGDPPPATYTLNLTADAGGTVAPNASGPYAPGTAVTITPTPSVGYTFNNWTVDGVSSADNPLVLTMGGNHTVVAHWTLLPTPLAKTRVYASDSPWNTVIGGSPTLHASNAAFVAALTDTTLVGENNFQSNAGVGLHFTSDPTQYAFPTYWVKAADTPVKQVRYTGLFSDVSASGVEHKYNGGGTVNAPFPSEATPSPGSDGSFVVVVDNGDIWGGWQLQNLSNGASFSCTNLYCLRNGMNRSGQQPVGFTSRGPAMGYEAGTIYAHEMIAALDAVDGTLGHALGFAYDIVTPRWVEPWATKSDGAFVTPGLPEGARLQFDPTITEAAFRARYATLHTAGGPSLTEDEIQMALVILRTGQQYGLIIVDHSGQRPGKIIPGGIETERWGDPEVPDYNSHVVWYINPAWVRVLNFTDTDGLAADTNPGTVQWQDTFTAEQTFNAASGGAFIRAAVGGVYSLNSSDKRLFGATGGEAWVSCLTANTGRSLSLPSVLVRDVTSVHSFRAAALPAGGPNECYVMLRMNPAGTYRYQLRVRVGTDGVVKLQPQAVSAAGTVPIGSEVTTTVTVTDPTVPLNVRFEAQGSGPTTLRARVWLTGVTEPATWAVNNSTDSTSGLQVAGGAGIQYSFGSGSTRAPGYFYTQSWLGTAL